MKSISTPAIIKGIRALSKANGLSINFTTPELKPEEMTVFFTLQDINVDITITPVDEKPTEEITIDADLETKTPSQRLRGSLYRLLESNLTRKPEHAEWEEFYRKSMEKIITDVQNQIDN
jgi:hypothetical protein